jgi:hypothetical protein
MYRFDDPLRQYLREQEQLRKALGDPLREYLREEAALRTAFQDPFREYLREQQQLMDGFDTGALSRQVTTMVEAAKHAVAGYDLMRQAAEDQARSLTESLRAEQLRMEQWYRPFAASLLADGDWIRRFQEGLESELTAMRQAALALDVTYRSLVPAFDPDGFLSHYPQVAALARLEAFATIDVMARLSVHRREADEDEVATSVEVQIDLQAHIDADLIPSLEALKPGLVRMLHGAREALASKNPDRVRQFVISNRELLTHVLHALAPDKEVKLWIPSPDLVENGRPTRRARLLYIARHINHEPFAEFVEADVAAAVATFKLLHKGAHEIEAGFTDSQAIALLQKVELTILFLLKIGQSEPN